MNEGRLGQFLGFIMDKMPDINKTEQVSVCLRYFSSATKESSIGFFSTNLTASEIRWIGFQEQVARENEWG